MNYCISYHWTSCFKHLKTMLSHHFFSTSIAKYLRAFTAFMETFSDIPTPMTARPMIDGQEGGGAIASKHDCWLEKFNTSFLESNEFKVALSLQLEIKGSRGLIVTNFHKLPQYSIIMVAVNNPVRDRVVLFHASSIAPATFFGKFHVFFSNASFTPTQTSPSGERMYIFHFF